MCVITADIWQGYNCKMGTTVLYCACMRIHGERPMIVPVSNSDVQPVTFHWVTALLFASSKTGANLSSEILC